LEKAVCIVKKMGGIHRQEVLVRQQSAARTLDLLWGRCAAPERKSTKREEKRKGNIYSRESGKKSAWFTELEMPTEGQDRLKKHPGLPSNPRGQAQGGERAKRG